MTAVALPARRPLVGPMGVSLLLHLAAIGAMVVVSARAKPRVLPPVYRVNLIAAPAGPRNVGVVNPAREAPPETPPPPRAEQKAPPATSRQAPPQQQQTRATTTPPRERTQADRAAEQAKAGGGDVGGRGTEPVNARVEGVEFPWQPYLDNIVRQIGREFPQRWPGSLRAEVAFMLDRNGRVKHLRITQRSGSYEFDLTAMGAVEAADRRNAFGPLPDGFAQEVLPVVFYFDPRIIQ